MNCKYCHKPAGLFSTKHEECEAKHTVAMEKLKEFFLSCTNKDAITYSEMKTLLASEIAKGYVSDEDIEAIIENELTPMLVDGTIENGYFILQFWDSLSDELKKRIKADCKSKIWWQNLKDKFFSNNDDETAEEESKGGGNCSGSGFIISDNILATNHHVIEGAEQIYVFLNDPQLQDPLFAKVIATDEVNDLALILINDPDFKPLKPAPYKISDDIIDVGTDVFTMGYPHIDNMGTEVKVTDGIISAKTGYKGENVAYQISAPIHAGNSGGPLFDKKGDLIGINTRKNYQGENIGYSVKTSYLLSLIKSAPIEIALPKGEDMGGKELSEMVKEYKPYIGLILCKVQKD